MSRSWLVKSEPDVYGYPHLERDGRTPWDGVRNYQARNYMRDEMRVGDRVLFYHSQTTPAGVAGVAEVASQAYPDATQFDDESPYFDPKATREEPRWMLVDVVPRRRLPRLVSLAEMKADPALEGMPVTKRGNRLSVMPVDEAHADHVETMAERSAEASA